MIAPERIAAIHARPLSEIIGRDLALKPAGRELQALCPFHNERTPSFTVNDRKGFYHCFGCGAHGDAIAFVRERYGLSMPAAVEAIDKDANLHVFPASKLPESRQFDRERDNSAELIAEILRGCRPAPGSPVETYLRSRGLATP